MQANPSLIFQTVFGLMPPQILKSAVNLGVFDAIASGKHRLTDIAETTESAERSLAYLLNALSALGFLHKPDAHHWQLNELSESFLVRGKHSYLGDFTQQIDMLWQPWSQTEQVVRTGNPVFSDTTMASMADYFKNMVAHLFPLTFGTACIAAQKLGLGQTRQGLKVLDIAAGAGPWGLGFTQADPTLHVTAFDFEQVLEVTKQHVERFGKSSQFAFKAGNILEFEPQPEYDLTVVGHLYHGFDQTTCQQLSHILAKTLKPGGQLVIADFFPDENRALAIEPLLFAMNMLVQSPGGNAYTLSEYQSWLSQSGFKEIEMVSLAPMPGGFITAIKA